MLNFLPIKIVAFLSIFSINLVFATESKLSVLNELPFGIKIGVTKNSEIENRGICIERIQVTENIFRCQQYSMANGSFIVYSSQNEIVNGLEFDGDRNHKFPQNWKKLGVILVRGQDGNNDDITPTTAITDQKKFLAFITAQGAENISITVTSYEPHLRTRIVFDLNGNNFTTEFYIYSYYNTDDQKVIKNHGVVFMKITESY